MSSEHLLSRCFDACEPVSSWKRISSQRRKAAPQYHTGCSPTKAQLFTKMLFRGLEDKLSWFYPSGASRRLGFFLLAVVLFFSALASLRFYVTRVSLRGPTALHQTSVNPKDATSAAATTLLSDVDVNKSRFSRVFVPAAEEKTPPPTSPPPPSKTDVGGPLPALWDTSEGACRPIGHDRSDRCDWKRIRTHLPPPAPAETFLCLRPYSDLVTNAVRQSGGWGDCHRLPLLHDAARRSFNIDPTSTNPATSTTNNSGKSEAKSSNIGRTEAGGGGLTATAAGGEASVAADHVPYMEIGVNIGACFVPMAHHPTASFLLGFEPSPKNLFYATSSLARVFEDAGKLPGESVRFLRQRVRLAAVALGESNASIPLFSEPGNAGNSVLGKPVHARTPEGAVPVVRMDDYFRTGGDVAFTSGVKMGSSQHAEDLREVYDGKKKIGVLKMDAQGFETKILKGATHLLGIHAFKFIHFELATEWLRGQGSSAAEFLGVLEKAGYKICGFRRVKHLVRLVGTKNVVQTHLAYSGSDDAGGCRIGA